MRSIWEILDVPPGSDRDAIRRAYAKKLRVTHPEDDPEGFKRLREAYEVALEQHDHAARWADDEHVAEEGTVEPSHRDWSATTPGAEPDDQSCAASEIDEILAGRDEELATLRAAMDDLAAGLHGPWRPGDGALEERLNAILSSPAMAEIGVRSDIEPWLADLLASTIPHSDAVLLQSIRAFGWGSDDHHLRGVSWPVAAVLGRLDEWRIIEELNHYSHRYHAAWRSLTRPPGPWWSWRIDAFRPGLAGGIETLLGEHGDVAPGLHYSFKTDSVERWRTFLARPRLTLGMLAMIPIAFLATLWLGYAVAGTGAVSQGWVIGGTALIGFATPAMILFTLARWRQHWRARDDRPRWQRQGWLGAYAVLAFAAMLLPPPWWPALVMLPAIAIAAWAYVALPRAEPQPLRIGGSAATFAIAAFFGLTMFEQLAPAEAFAIGTMAALLVHLRIAAWPAVRRVLDELTWRHREWIILGAVLAGLGVAGGIWWLRTLWHPALPFYVFALAAIALVPLVSAPDRDAGGPPRWIARVVLILAFFWAFSISVPPSRHEAAAPEQLTLPSQSESSQSSQSSQSSDRSTLYSREAASLESIDATMAMLEREQPGFRQVRRGNKSLYAKVRAVMTRYYRYEITRNKADKEVGALVNDAYRRMAPDADSALLAEGLRIRLELERALRVIDPAACAAGITPSGKGALPEALRSRQNAQIFNIVSNPPASRREIAAGTPIDGGALSARVAGALHIDRKALSDRVSGKQGPATKCDVRIAVTQAILDSNLDDIAATLRRDLRRARDEKPIATPETKKAGDRQGQSPA